MRKILLLAFLSMFIGVAGCTKHEQQMPAAPEASASAEAPMGEASPMASPAGEASPEASPAASPAAP